VTSTAAAAGSSERQGDLWGARARDWAENEVQQAPTYAEAIRRVALAPGQRVLDVGCGSGVFLQAAAELGADVCGLDASAALIEIARERVPGAVLHVGDMQSLPFADDDFDVVAGFNSFFFATDMVAALREAARVAKPGAPVVIQTWGRPERCDLTAVLRAIGALRSSPPGGPPAPPLSHPGVLEQLAAQAGLTPNIAFDLSYALDYPDEDTLVRRLQSPGGAIEAIRTAGEQAVRTAIIEALAAHRASGGGYRLENEWHYLIARA